MENNASLFSYTLWIEGSSNNRLLYEIKIEKPSNLLAKAETWSHYKHLNTVKILITIAPQGMTTFVSSSWGGRVSDKHLTMDSGLLQKLLPGDVVLADHGFNVGEVVAMVQVSLHMPAFTKSLDQLPPVVVWYSLRASLQHVLVKTRTSQDFLQGTKS